MTDAPRSDPTVRDTPLADAGSEPATGDHPTSEDAATPVEEPQGPPPEEPPPAITCDIATDNPCLRCDQASCCEPRRACLELDGCACRLECRTAEHPEDCNAGCPDPTDRYEPWLQCLHEHCAEACAL